MPVFCPALKGLSRGWGRVQWGEVLSLIRFVSPARLHCSPEGGWKSGTLLCFFFQPLTSSPGGGERLSCLNGGSWKEGEILAMGNVAANLENSLAGFQRLNRELPHKPAILLLYMCLRELKIHMSTQNQMFIAALFILAQSQNNPNVYQLVNG